jgi:hypothetical protein
MGARYHGGLAQNDKTCAARIRKGIPYSAQIAIVKFDFHATLAFPLITMTLVLEVGRGIILYSIPNRQSYCKSFHM